MIGNIEVCDLCLSTPSATQCYIDTLEYINLSLFNLLPDCICPRHHLILNGLQFVLANTDRKCDPLSFFKKEACLRSIVPKIAFAKA